MPLGNIYNSIINIIILNIEMNLKWIWIPEICWCLDAAAAATESAGGFSDPGFYSPYSPPSPFQVKVEKFFLKKSLDPLPPSSFQVRIGKKVFISHIFLEINQNKRRWPIYILVFVWIQDQTNSKICKNWNITIFSF